METLKKIQAFESKYRNGIQYILVWAIFVLMVL